MQGGKGLAAGRKYRAGRHTGEAIETAKKLAHGSWRSSRSEKSCRKEAWKYHLLKSPKSQYFARRVKASEGAKKEKTVLADFVADRWPRENLGGKSRKDPNAGLFLELRWGVKKKERGKWGTMKEPFKKFRSYPGVEFRGIGGRGKNGTRPSSVGLELNKSRETRKTKQPGKSIP